MSTVGGQNNVVPTVGTLPPTSTPHTPCLQSIVVSSCHFSGPTIRWTFTLWGQQKLKLGCPFLLMGDTREVTHYPNPTHMRVGWVGVLCPVSFLVRIIPGVHFATKTTITNNNNPFVCAHTLTSSSSSFYSSSDATVRLPLLAGGRRWLAKPKDTCPGDWQRYI